MSMKKPVNNAQPELTIILLNYNGWTWLDQCLHSFHHLENWTDQGPEKLEVMVVDNGSQERKLPEFQEKYPWIQTMQLEENRGFAAGNNAGIQQAKAPYIMLLNTDTEFPAQTPLLSLLDRFVRPDVAIVSPKVVLSNGELDHACHRGFPTPWNALMYFSGLAKLFPKVKFLAGYRQSWLDLNTVHEIEACTGAAMIVRKTAIEGVGLLDEDYFMYAEDIDWCYRFAQAGWKTLYDPSVTVVHHKHKSGQKNKQWDTKSRTIAAFFDTMKQFMDKHYRKKYPQVILFLSFVMIDLLKKRKLHQERKQYANE